MEFEFEVEGKIHKVSVDIKGGTYQVNLGRKTFKVEAQKSSENCFSLFLNSEFGAGSSTPLTPLSLTTYIVEKDKKILLSIGGERFVLKEPKPKEEKKIEVGTSPKEGKKTVIAAIMPGKVVKVEVSPGDQVEKNQSLVILEAMKMENEIRAPISGKVEKVYVSASEQVNAGAPLIELIP